jgi:peptide/nickel transport system substrate-binding protein
VIAVGAVATGDALTANKSSVAEERAGQAANSITINRAGQPTNLDPAAGCSASNDHLVMNTYVRLVQYGTKPGPSGTRQIDAGKIVPYFAKSWKISKNGLVYTFKLHDGLKFPSGQPVDARAVKYSFDRTATMNQCGLYYIWDGLYEPPLIKSITAPNATTVVFRLNTRDPNALQSWAQAPASIVDKSVVDAHGGVQKGKPNKWMASNVAGSGPYVLEQYEAGTRAVLAPNPQFTLPNRPTQKVTINYIGSDSTLLLQARSGGADVTIGMSSRSATSLQDDACCNVAAYEKPSMALVYLSWKAPSPTARKEFREALTYATPYRDILKAIANGFGSLFYGPVPPVMPEFNRSLERPRAYDVNKAKQILAKAGIETPVSLELLVRANEPVHTQIATALQGAWSQIGVNVQIRPLSAAAFSNAIYSKKFQAAVTSDGPSVIDAGYYLRYAMRCKDAYNLLEICMPAADKLLARTQNVPNPSAQQKLWNRLITIWRANSPLVALYSEQEVVVLNKKVRGYVYSHLGEFGLLRAG